MLFPEKEQIMGFFSDLLMVRINSWTENFSSMYFYASKYWRKPTMEKSLNKKFEIKNKNSVAQL